MKLSFGTEVNHQPNYFLEKIWKALCLVRVTWKAVIKFSVVIWRNSVNAGMEYLWRVPGAKIHTIRRDLDNEWVQE
ncbi:hypothetical protein CS542_02900 [Pedobacter sp. IW39]|nr:hypothetical protein CS542_02900 [Pedobacter sp. IW39]